MQLSDKYNALTASLASLGYTLYKGYPTFGTPQFLPPYLAVVYAHSQKLDTGRIGNEKKLADLFRIFVVATNEVELLQMLQDIRDWIFENKVIVNDNDERMLSVLYSMNREFDYAEMDLENYVVSIILALS